MAGFDPNQPRDDHGEWTAGKLAAKKKNAQEAKRLIEAHGVPAEIYQKPGDAIAAIYSNTDNKIHINQSNKYWQDPVGRSRALAESGQLASDKPEGLVHHELAHAMYDPPKNFSGGGRGPHADIARQVSKYAARNPSEFVAEVHSGISTGKNYSNEVMGLFNQYAKKRAK